MTTKLTAAIRSERCTPIYGVLLIGGLIVPQPSRAVAQAKFVTAFNSTSYASCDGWGDMNQSKAAADFFMANLVEPGGELSWEIGIRSSDDRPVMSKYMGSSWFSGDNYFDDYSPVQGFDFMPGISFYQGHGWPGFGVWRDGSGTISFDACDPADPEGSCPPPPRGTFGPPVCLMYPTRSPCPEGENCRSDRAAVSPWCAYRFDHAIHTCAPSENEAQHRLDYSMRDSEMRLGESNNGAPWNTESDRVSGGTQMAVIAISHASQLGSFGSDLGGMFGGMDAVASVFTMGGDTADVADRGPVFGTLIHDFPSSALQQLWTLTSTMTTSGSGCPGFERGTAHGGFNGCGGHVFMVLDLSTQASENKLATLTPAALQDVNVHPASGSGSIARSAMFSANWDLSVAPAILSAQNF